MIILELLNKNKITFDKTALSNKNIESTQYINNTLKEKIKLLCKDIPNSLYTELSELVQACEKKEFLIDHTPYSLVIGCFYYLLTTRNYNIHLRYFATLYSLSTITVLKIVNKLNRK